MDKELKVKSFEENEEVVEFANTYKIEIVSITANAMHTEMYDLFYYEL